MWCKFTALCLAFKYVYLHGMAGAMGRLKYENNMQRAHIFRQLAKINADLKAMEG
jgi:hypothetical protein